MIQTTRRGLAAVACALATCMSAAFAGPTSPAVRAEIDALLARLVASGCEFQRNNAWHTAADARTHLLRKLESIEGKTTLESTERFIALGATTSSASGKPYQVKCGGGKPVASAQWLTQELTQLRAAKPKQ